MIRAGYYLVLSLLLSFSVQAADEKAAPLHGLSTLKSSSVANSTLSTGSYIQMILGLLFIVLLIFALAWLMRRMGRLQSVMGGSMKLLGGVSLGQRERAMLVQVGETQMLLGVAPGSVRTLHVFDKPVVTASAAAAGNSFADKLNAVLKQKAGK
ncbi:MAG TPA: flagellar biosynthetic protein FliO [Gammaproteobacteria bacterium]|nr:flagellar biosynthetic protein FliO [Gammaproteobacteria bacterium]